MASLSDIQVLADKIARGGARPDSDVDLMVIMNSGQHPARTAAEITHRVHPRRYPLALIVRSPEPIRGRLQMNDWFVRDVMREGRVLYAGLDSRVGSVKPRRISCP